MAITKYGSTVTDSGNGWKAYIIYNYTISETYMTITLSEIGVIGTTSSNYTYAAGGVFSLNTYDEISIDIVNVDTNSVVTSKTYGPTGFKGITISSNSKYCLQSGVNIVVNKTFEEQNLTIHCSIGHDVGILGRQTGTTSSLISDPIELIGLETTTISFLQGDSNRNAPESITIQKGGDWTVPNIEMTRDNEDNWTELITYTFAGWKVSTSTDNTAAYIKNGSYKDPMLGDISLLPVYISQSQTKYRHSISFDPNGETSVTNMPAQIQGYWFSALTSTTYTIPNDIPVCEGLMFSHWRDEEENIFAAGDSIVVPGNTNIILYAVWIVAESNLYLDANEGELQDLSNSYHLTYNASFYFPEDIPRRIGFNFLYWTDVNANNWLAGSLYKNSSSLYNIQNRLIIPDDNYMTATWEENFAVIQYNANGGTLESVPSQEITYYTQQYYITDEIPIRDNYTFLGWSEDSSSTTVQYYENQLYKQNNVIPQGIKLFAVWKSNNDISEAEIIYNANGGSLNGITSPQGINFLQAASIQSIEPVRSGYVFNGWKAKNSNRIYQPGDQYKEAESFPAKITLYAQWLLNGYMWIGKNNIAKKITNIYIGNSNNIAKPIIGIYVGDENNKAKKIL